MKSFVKYSITFLCFSILTYFILIFFWGSVMPIWLNSNLIYKQRGGHLHSRLSELDKYQNVDVLFLGSSHVYRGFDTRIFKESGVHSFNLGSSSQAPAQSLMLLKKHIDNLQPKKIIFEVCPQSLSSDGIESALDIISNGKIDIQTIKMAIELNHIKVYNTLIYSGIRQLLNLDKDFNQEILERMVSLKDLVSEVHSVRKDNDFRVRQPLYADFSKMKLEQGMLDLILRECNLLLDKDLSRIEGKTWEKTNPFGTIKIDLVVDDNLKILGALRDLKRSVQDFRKKQGLQPGQNIKLRMQKAKVKDPQLLEKVLQKNNWEELNIKAEWVENQLDPKIDKRIKIKDLAEILIDD